MATNKTARADYLCVDREEFKHKGFRKIGART